MSLVKAEQQAIVDLTIPLLLIQVGFWLKGELAQDEFL
jgi:hypothetical protein